jgi:UDP-3-O-[3-hydroxymyristoyl] glucosamine N-acyltransferase
MNAQTKGISVAELAAHAGGRVIGDGSIVIKGVASLESAGDSDIVYVDNEKFFEAARTSQATCLIVPEGFKWSASQSQEAAGESKGGTSHAVPLPRESTLIVVRRPRLAFALVAELLHPGKEREPSIHPTAVVAATADLALTAFIGAYVCVGENTRIAAGTRIESGVVIGENVLIGANCVIYPNAVLYDNITLGDRVILHAGVSIGADGFGYVRGDMDYHKFPQIGTVVIEDDVELGAHTCVDRAALGQTRIGRGTKLDNMVHVGHNVDIGERVVIAAQTGISGSTVIEDDAVIGGQVGFGDHARVQKGAVIGSKAGVLPGKIVRPGVWWGIPVQPLDEYKRLNAHLSRLPRLREEISELRKQIEELQERSK